MLPVQKAFLRRIILNAFNNNGEVAIGLKDEGHEGTWKWINGPGHRTLYREVGLWRNTEPDGGISQNCGTIWNDFYTHDYPCNWNRKALCEKEV